VQVWPPALSLAPERPLPNFFVAPARPCGQARDALFVGGLVATLVGLVLVPVGIATNKPLVAVGGGFAVLGGPAAVVLALGPGAT
jgi:hypothetical protein